MGSSQQGFVSAWILDSLTNGVLAILDGKGVNLLDPLILNPWVVIHCPVIGPEQGIHRHIGELRRKHIDLPQEVLIDCLHFSLSLLQPYLLFLQLFF